MAFDFEGARRICDAICEDRPEYLAGQPGTISRVASGYIAIEQGDYARAIEYFRHVCVPEVTVKFFLHWVWRMTAQLESGNAWLLSGDIPHARTAANESLGAALSTADPHLHALAWELKTRVAMAENDLKAARGCIEQSLAIVDKFEILGRGLAGLCYCEPVVPARGRSRPRGNPSKALPILHSQNC